MNPKVYLNSANGLDEMMDSLGNSESTKGGDDDSDGLPPKKRRYGRENDDRGSFRLLADSIQKFSNIYEKIENSKRKQMVELEKMRMDFHRDLELAQAEIAKIQQGNDAENDNFAENANGYMGERVMVKKCERNISRIRKISNTWFGTLDGLMKSIKIATLFSSNELNLSSFWISNMRPCRL
ncbi:hypothetical protein DVH24_000163 [Malus domestica]|uniref:Uncharacterized protein n=1 Tax=Malus domestica TaxID=3750 RepID=A0A498J2H4_MALDO|nr:hypothetical protein DVH24_000163 [Malus domestica]